MTDTFELFADEGSSFRFRIKAPDGTVMAISRAFPDKRSAVAGIEAVREYAGMGLIADRCPEVPLRGPVAGSPATAIRMDTRPPQPGPAAGGLRRILRAGPPGLKKIA